MPRIRALSRGIGRAGIGVNTGLSVVEPALVDSRKRKPRINNPKKKTAMVAGREGNTMYTLNWPTQDRINMVAELIKEAKKSRSQLKRERMSSARNAKVQMPEPAAASSAARSGASNPTSSPRATRSGAVNPPAPTVSATAAKATAAKAAPNAAPKAIASAEKSTLGASAKKLFSGRNLRRAGKVGLGLGALGGLAYGAHKLTTKTAALFDELDKIAQAMQRT